MATMVESLFGITPEMYTQARDQRADEQALAFARLSPFEKASFGISRGAYGLAGAIGGALGGQDPELQRISARNAISRQIDYTNPESMQQGIQALAQAGDTVGAMQLTDVLRKLQSEQALQFQRTAAGQASLAAAGRERVQATPEKVQLAQQFALRKGQPGSPEYEAEFTAQLTRLTTTEKPEAMTAEMRNAAALAALKGAPGSPEYVAEYNAQLTRLTTKPESREPTTTALTQARVIASRAGPEGSPEYNRAFDAEYKRLTEPKPAVSVTNVLPGQEKAINANKAKLAGDVETGALNAPDRLTLARNMKELLPNAFTGIGSDIKLQASKVAEAFGIRVTGTNESEIIDQILSQMTLGSAGQLKGALSDKDVAFLKQTIGSRGLTRATLQFVADRIEREALIDTAVNESVNKWQQDKKSLNDFNFVEARSTAAKKVDADLKRLRELRAKQGAQPGAQGR